MQSEIIIGTRVTILPNAEYGDQYNAASGTVSLIFRKGMHTLAGVKLDGILNPASRQGLFYFKTSHLLCEKAEEDFMFEGYKRAEISFIEGTNSDRIYHYALYDNVASIGDIVVVNTGHHGISLARITAISDDHLDLVSCGREIVAKVDFSAYTARKKRGEKIAQLKLEMDKKVQQLQQYAVYEMLAEKDPELKAMLDDLKKWLICDITPNK